MSSDNKVPDVRFNGFSTNWKNFILNQITDVYDGTHQTPIYTKSGVMFLSAENIKSLTSAKFISKEAFNQEFKVFPQKNDVLMTRIGDVGTANVVETDDNRAYYVTLALLKYKGLNSYFLKNSIMSPFVQRDIWLKTLHIAFPKKINMNELKQVSVKCPQNTDESNKIGNYFQKLDTLINQHQQKHDKLCNIKKAMLEKMFPKPGKTTPEIRFKEFGGEWEKKTLSETAPLRAGFAFQSLEFCHNGIPIVKISNILSTGEVGGEFSYYKEISNDENYLLLDGSALLAMSGATTGKVSILKCHDDTKFYQNQRVGYFQRNVDFDYLFISTLVRSHIFRDKLDAVLVAGAQPNVSSKEIDSFEFMMPYDIKEQLAIGNCFQKLDNLINQHQQQISKLNNIKQACLSKMFV